MSRSNANAGSDPLRAAGNGRVPSMMERFSVRLASFAGACAFVGGTAIACPFAARDDAGLADELAAIDPGLTDAATVVASAALPLR